VDETRNYLTLQKLAGPIRQLQNRFARKVDTVQRFIAPGASTAPNTGREVKVLNLVPEEHHSKRYYNLILFQPRLLWRRVSVETLPSYCIHQGVHSRTQK
jgi:hypothetical protein